MIRKYYLVFLCCGLLSFQQATIAQIVQWKSFTSVGEIRDLAISENRIWGGSSGGAIRLRSGDSELIQVTNTEGLSKNDVMAIAVDQRGTIWFALQNGLLNRWFPEDKRMEVFDFYREKQITDMVVFGDSLYIGLGVGVSLFTIDRLEVKETYQNLGLSGGDVEKIGANSILIHNSDIWVATNKGIAKASLDSANLQAPAVWVQYTTAQGLLSDKVNELVVLAETPYAATARGVARLTNGSWSNVGQKNSAASALQIVGQDTLVAVFAGDVFRLTSAETWQRLGEALGDVTAILATGAGAVWIGRKNKGIAEYNFLTGQWQLTVANAPASNNFNNMLLDSRGRLWCASRIGGIHILDNRNWINLSKSTGLPVVNYRDLLEDRDGRIWAGSWGGGVTIIELTDSDISLTKIDTTGGILAGVLGDDPGFPLVPGLVQDQFDNIWMLNREALNNKVLVSHTPDNQYVYFSTADIVSRFLNIIEVDRAGRIWLGTQDRGVQVVEYHGTLPEPDSVDFGDRLNVSEDGLYSNNITALTEDNDGAMWIGSDVGLNLWFGGVVANEFDTPVNAIGIDAINNKWIGTQNGITILRGHREKIGDVTVGNSDLVSGNVLSFVFNTTTGEVWIGTDNGLSRAQTLITAPKKNFDQLTGYPNPFVIGSSVGDFTIINLRVDSNVRIFNSAGKFIKRLEVTGGKALWDGKDENGKPVASGIFIYLAYTNNDVSASGKLAVIRR